MTFNNATTKVISVLLFFANYEFKSETFKKSRQFAQLVQKVTIQIKQLQLLHKELQKNIQFLSKRSTLYANKKKDRKFTFKEKDKVFLLRRNIKTKRLSNKLNYTKLKSFEILKVKRLVNYKLNLLAYMRIHSIFHIFLLESANQNTLIQVKTSEIDSENQDVKYKVKNISN